MPGSKKKSKKKSDLKAKQHEIQNTTSDNCPVKDGDNCLVPGGFNDSEPIGGG
ncbi:MAG: hypothetical protein GX808_05020 [Syntrophomonadaceae bacterium]|jgi:hypothetical protein|nr:hypothetical protein [Syntrophomonadaceae bacterium]